MNNNSAPFQNRNVTLDLMKALAIFLVVMDHLLIAADGEENAFRVFIYSLHIPLFFIVSGYLASAKIYRVSDVFHFIRKKSRLLIPLLVFSIGDVIILRSEAKDWLTWHKFGLWFLWVLFLFFIIYSISQLLLIKNKNKFLEIAILLAPVLVCVILRKWQDSIIGGVFNFLNLYNYVFFILGVLVRRYGWEYDAHYWLFLFAITYDSNLCGIICCHAESVSGDAKSDDRRKMMYKSSLQPI